MIRMVAGHQPPFYEWRAKNRLLWSQIYGLGANMVVPRLEGAPRDDVDSDAQEFLKILEQADVIKKGGAWLKVHEQV